MKPKLDAVYLVGSIISLILYLLKPKLKFKKWQEIAYIL
jgi:hypothetical protein